MKNLIFLTFLLFTSKYYAQYDFLASSHTFDINENDLKVFQIAHFSKGSGLDCPPMVDYQFSVQADTIYLSLTYNVMGPYPTFYCSRMDTIVESFATGVYALIVNSHVIHYDPTNAVIDTTKVDADTSYNLILNIQNPSLDPAIDVFPNPAADRIYLDYPSKFSLEGVEMIGVDGKSLELNWVNKKELDVLNLKSGIYFLKMDISGKSVYRKIVIE